MSNMRISLFGKLIIQCFEQNVIALEARRAQELLCFFLLYRDRLHEREKLATLLWGDKSTTRSKQYLRQTLWQVQSTLHLPTLPEPILLVKQNRIGINPQANFWLDVAVFDQAFAAVEKIAGSALNPAQLEMLRTTLPLYAGALLEGWYEDWCTYERERYQNMYLAMLDKLLNYSETHHDYEAGLAYGAQILHYDRARERTHRSLMRLYYKAGHRTAALQQYKVCVAALAEELDVGPARSTVTLYQQICADQANGAVNGVPEKEALLPNGGTAPPAVLHQLEQLQVTLSQLQTQVTELIENFGQNPSDFP